MARCYTNTATFYIVLTGSSFIHKYLYKNPSKLLKIPFTSCIDTWLDIDSNFVIRIKFKRVS